MGNAPVIVFVYNRLEHTRRLFESLIKNQGADMTDVYVFSDAAKITGNEKVDKVCRQKVAEVRDYISTIDGFKGVYITLREKNYGLANNIISAVTQVLKQHDSAIILEDDLMVSPSFLLYMNTGLKTYRDSEKVFSISGYSYISESDQKKGMPQSYFLPIMCSWGWATWSSKWKIFDKRAEGWEVLRWNWRKRYRFNFHNAIDYYSMLRSQMEEDIDSWAIRWYWSVFKEEGLTLYSLNIYVDNGGFDGSGTHTMGEQVGGKRSLLNQIERLEMPAEEAVDKEMRKIAVNNIGGGILARNFHVFKQEAAHYYHKMKKA